MNRGLGRHPPRYAAQVKWTSTIDTRLLSQIGRSLRNPGCGYNPLNIAWEYRDWQDCYRDGPGGNSCSGADPYGTNGDDVVQDWEVGPGQDDFGARHTNNPDPNIRRPYHLRTNIAVDHQLTPWLGVTAAWNYSESRLSGRSRDLVVVLRQSATSDPEPAQVTMPWLVFVPRNPGRSRQISSVWRDDSRY